MKTFEDVVLRTGARAGSAPSMSVDVVRDSQDGRFELYFCSTVCGRRFFAARMGRLDEELKQPVAEFAVYRPK